MREYIIKDINTDYKTSLGKENLIAKLVQGILKGFINYAGFECEVLLEEMNE